MSSGNKNHQFFNDSKYVALSQDFFKKYISKGSTIGLGSGSTVEKIVRNFGLLEYKDTLEFVVTSLQIRIVSESIGLKIIDQKDGNIDVVLDGADQIDSGFNMIKGGGGALLKEKILISSAKKFVVFAQANKFVDKFSMAIPIEVTPFGRIFVMRELEKIGGLPRMRMLDKGYPFVTENGNIIYDTLLPKYNNIKETEKDLKNIPGVIEVGLFTNHADSYYKIHSENDFESIIPRL
ncbi:MAG: ribose 5-phosphate isomerase A [Nitrososphaeraceae archaeon]|nr:ribose 5-phosphate isomerase A [Nitrososphaeraceae archaeon]MDW0151445.1 ribose 5-phosphate isomerase A [Nitrososphaeraceae archaeon]MDW0166889.1 ribose 5-phosphate isomerase A [Nitrososphaeraceae archaeon]